jgi:hypothetical protein
LTVEHEGKDITGIRAKRGDIWGTADSGNNVGLVLLLA